MQVGPGLGPGLLGRCGSLAVTDEMILVVIVILRLSEEIEGKLSVNGSS